ncbi:LOW QUALITY PROTEIN: putative uncharacterized protein CXorf58 homolog [Camelus ferus]|uniref:Uncharacterized protein n=2 Tax=Camelus TaxID=9836 RepID=A0A8B8SMY1_CAMFR|nr:LOW QUALITY PROTEIN: putative uncharacterized protein CXorf58 homolog [Camelus ferus]
MSLAAAAPAGSPGPWPRPLGRGSYGGRVGSNSSDRKWAAVRMTAAAGKRPLSVGGTRGRKEGGAGSRAALGIFRHRRDWAPSGVGWESYVRRPPGGGAQQASGGLESLAAGSRRPRGLDLPHKRNKEISAHRIQRAWLSHLDKTVFQLLKYTVCAAEYHVTHEILKKVSPLEAELVKDPCMKCKVRVRFSGETFPPLIVFKIFLHTEGHGYKYFSGKNLLKPSSEAVVDACKVMGEKKFYHQIMEDEHLFQKFKITKKIDIVTLKDYVQYSSLLDETPASSGGRNNYWRRLNLESIPRTMIMYDIVDYAETGIISNRLKKVMKYLLQRPKTEEMRQHQLRIVSEVRSSFSSLQPLYRRYQQQSQIKHLGRRSKQAQMKVEKMRKAYKMAKEKNVSAESVFSRITASIWIVLFCFNPV